MTKAKNNEGYGRYIQLILTASDLILLNIIFVLTCLLSHDMIREHARVTMFLVNLSYLPIALWFKNNTSQRTIYMDHIFLRVIQTVGIHALLFVTMSYVLKIWHIPAKTLLVFYTLMFTGFTLWWSIARRITKHYRSIGRNFIQAVIIGTNPTALRLYEEMLSDAGYGYKVMGFFDNDCPDDFKGNYLGTIDSLDSYVKAQQIDEIYFAISGQDDETIGRVIKIADDNVVQFYFVPQISRYINRGFDLYNMGPVAVMTLRCNPLKRFVNRLLKRSFDLFFSSIVLLFSPIVFIPVAIAIKLSSPGPVFFKQKRTGHLGKDFNCWKFRTMKVNDDSDSKQAEKDDPRKTRVGDFLRKTSIDELPQFINVFLGDMSVVGPRPHMLKHTLDYSKLIDKYMVRHAIKPGITGWAQVNGYRGQTEQLWQMEKRVEHDVWYIENWTFLLDIKIIIRTVMNAIQGEKNAF